MAQRMDIAETADTSGDQASAPTSHAKDEPSANKPTCIVCLRMAGSGKTTFCRSVSKY